MKKDLVTTEIIVKENKVGILRIGNVNYISLIDLARYQNSSDPSFTVKNWLRRINTIDYIGLWEEIHNQDFNLVEFDQIKTEYGRNSFSMSPTRFIIQPRKSMIRFSFFYRIFEWFYKKKVPNRTWYILYTFFMFYCIMCLR